MATTFPVVAPHDDALDVLKQFGSSNVQQIPVVEDHALVGMVYQRDLLRWLEAGATRPSSSPQSNGPSSFRPKHA